MNTCVLEVTVSWHIFLLSVGEHVLLKVLSPHEHPVAVVTLQVLGPRVNHHVRCQVGFLREGLLAHCAPVILLTCRQLCFILYLSPMQEQILTKEVLS